MMRWIPAVLFSACALVAQNAAPDLAPGKADARGLAAATRALERSANVPAEAKTEADKLIAESRPLQMSGQTGEAMRRLAHAYALLKGQPWGAGDEFAWSLSLRPEQVVADPALPLIAKVTQIYAAPYHAAGLLTVRAALVPANGTARQLGQFEVMTRDLVEQPFGFDADLDGAGDGLYTLEAEVRDGDQSVAKLTAPVQVVRGIQTGRDTLERRMTRIHGHDSTKATIRYPWVLAETVNTGRRQFNQADFGIPFFPQLSPYDFVKGVAESNRLLAALEAGRDPLWRAKGNHERHYWFEEAREMMPFHVYTPTTWDGHSKLPMVLVLHGNTRDQDYYFDRDDHILAKLGEQHGYLVVCPMGYRPNAGWGSATLARAGVGRGGFMMDPARLRQSELSERDALNVLDLVTKEYPIDASRIYLFGHSAGGGGTWYMGEKYAKKWAAIAASAAPTRPENFPFERLKGVPILVCHGDKDDEVPVMNSRNMVKAAKEHGLDPQYLEVPGATHLTIVALVEPKVFDFFDAHKTRH
jgi:dienelactone hydrolase